MKRILFLIILIFSFFSLNRADINDVTFVKTIGISENDGHVEMILNTIVPEKGLDTSTYQIQSIVLEGHDVGEMLNSFLSEHYQHVSFDQLELLLLDDEMTQNFSQLVEPVMNRFVRLNFYVGLVKDANIAELLYNQDTSVAIVKKLKNMHYTMKNILVSYFDDQYLYIPTIEGVLLDELQTREF